MGVSLLHVFVSIVILGKTAITVGPMPYTIKDCETRKYEAMAPFYQVWGAGRSFRLEKKKFGPGDVEVRCVAAKDKDRPEPVADTTIYLISPPAPRTVAALNQLPNQ